MEGEFRKVVRLALSGRRRDDVETKHFALSFKYGFPAISLKGHDGAVVHIDTRGPLPTVHAGGKATIPRALYIAAQQEVRRMRGSPHTTRHGAQRKTRAITAREKAAADVIGRAALQWLGTTRVYPPEEVIPMTNDDGRAVRRRNVALAMTPRGISHNGPRTKPIHTRYSQGFAQWARTGTGPEAPTNLRALKLLALRAPCSEVLTLPQRCADGGICWFTAVLMQTFFSQHMRAVVIRAFPDAYAASSKTHRWLLDRIAGLLRAYTQPRFEGRTVDVLRDMYAAAPKHFDLGLQDGNGGRGEPYFRALLDFLRIPQLHLYYDGRRYRLSVFNKKLSQENLVYSDNLHNRADEPRELADTLDMEHPVVLVMHERSYNVRRPWMDSKGRLPLTSHTRTSATYNGLRYVADSVGIMGVGGEGAHAIAAVTCNEGRYLYNGWPRYGRQGKNESDVCPLIKFDWGRRRTFVLDQENCTVRDPPDTNAAPYRFDFDRGSTWTVYVRSDVAVT